MTSVDLGARADRALVGTLLVDPSQRDGLPALRPQDFTDPRSRDLFSAVIASGVAVDVEHALAQLRASGEDIAGLRGMLSNTRSGDASVYARLVAEAGLRRGLVLHAGRIESDAERGTDTGHTHAARLAQALRGRGDFGSSGSAGNGQAVSVEDGPNATLEDKVLAVLIQDRELFTEVRSWLSADCFAPGIRRDTREAMAVVFNRGEPVNDLTVAWQLTREKGPLEDAESGYLKRLATMPVDPVDGLEAGRDLIIAVFRAESAVMVEEMSRANRDAAQRPETYRSVRHAAHETDRPAPELLQPPPTPQLGPDGPRIGW